MGSLGNRENRWLPDEEPQRDLARRRIVLHRDLVQHATASRVSAGKAVMAKWAIAHDGNAVLLAPWDHRVFDGPFLQMVEHLVAHEPVSALDRLQGLEIAHIEIA